MAFFIKSFNPGRFSAASALSSSNDYYYLLLRVLLPGDASLSFISSRYSRTMHCFSWVDLASITLDLASAGTFCKVVID